MKADEASPNGRPSRRQVLHLCGAFVGLAVLAATIRIHWLPAAILPMPVDAAYYYAVAENLHDHRGFVIDYAWNYLRGVPEHLPIPSNDYWQPLTSLVLAASFLVAPASWATAQAVAVIFGCLMVLMALWFAWRMTGSVWLGLLAGVYVAFRPQSVLESISTDTPPFFAVFGGLALMVMVVGFMELEGAKAPPKAGRVLVFAAALGVLSGLAYLVRTDGALMLLTASYLFWRLKGKISRGGAASTGGERVKEPRADSALKWVGVMWVAFLVAILPWLVRNYLAFGSPMPGGLAKTALMVSYSDVMSSQPERVTLARYLSQGAGAILHQKAVTLWITAVRLADTCGRLILALAFWELLAGRKRFSHLPVLLHLLLIWLVASVVLTAVSLRGTWHHMAVIFVPILPGFALLGLKRLWEKVAADKRLFLGLGAAAFVLAVIGVGVYSTLPGVRLNLAWAAWFLIIYALPGLALMLMALLGRIADARWWATLLFLTPVALLAASILRFPIDRRDVCERWAQLERNVASFVDADASTSLSTGAQRQSEREKPILNDNPWHYWFVTRRPAYMFPQDAYARTRKMARRLGVRYMVLSPRLFTDIPPLANWIAADDSAVVGIIYSFAEVPNSEVAGSLSANDLARRWEQIRESRKPGERAAEDTVIAFMVRFLDPLPGEGAPSSQEMAQAQERSARGLTAMGRRDWAIIAFAKALRLIPEAPDAHANLARALLEDAVDPMTRPGKPPRAVELRQAFEQAEKAAALAPDRVGFRALSDMIARELGKTEPEGALSQH